jgi:alpha-beta hydrolase superfamily lysophospholipase
MNSIGLAAAMILLAAAPVAAASRHVTFPSTDGTLLTAALYEPSARPAPAIVLVHMLGRSKEDWNSIADRLEAAGAIVLALDLRGHGRSGGSAAALPPMIEDVRAAIAWVATRPETRPGAVAVVGGSLGANLALLAGADNPSVRAVALLSPSGDYRGVRLDAGIVRKLADRPVWLAASTHDAYALRTIRDLMQGTGVREQRLSGGFAHGTALLTADPELARGLVDWLRRTLIF